MRKTNKINFTINKRMSAISVAENKNLVSKRRFLIRKFPPVQYQIPVLFPPVRGWRPIRQRHPLFL